MNIFIDVFTDVFLLNEVSRKMLPFTECCNYKQKVLLTVGSVGPK